MSANEKPLILLVLFDDFGSHLFDTPGLQAFFKKGVPMRNPKISEKSFVCFSWGTWVCVCYVDFESFVQWRAEQRMGVEGLDFPALTKEGEWIPEHR